MAANLQKLKLLYIAKMLVEETDAVAGLTMAQILERLEAHGGAQVGLSRHRVAAGIRPRYPDVSASAARVRPCHAIY